MKLRKILWVLLTALLLTGCSGGISQSTPAPELMEPAAVSPNVAAAFLGEFYVMDCHEVHAVPYVAPVYASGSGRVDTLYAYPGKEVKAGEVLLTLNQSSLLAQLENAEASFLRMKDNYANSNAQAELDIRILDVQLRQLQSQGAGQNRIALKQNEIAQAQAALRQEQAKQLLDIQERELALEQLRARLSDNTICAPFDGQIVSIQTDSAGDELATGAYMTDAIPAFWISDDSRLSLQGPKLSQSYFDNAGRVYARLGSEEYGVRLMSQEDIAAKTSGFSDVSYYELLDESGSPISLEKGQMGLICVLRNYVQNAVLIPSNAIMEEGSISYVFVQENGQRVRRDVNVGGISSGLAYIISGIQEGEYVYVE